MRDRWGKIPFLAMVLCLGSGIGLSRAIADYSFALLSLGCLILGLAGLLALRRGRCGTALAAALLTISLSGLLLALAQRDAISEHDLRSLLSRQSIPLEGALQIDGCVSEEVRMRGEEYFATVELHGYRTSEKWSPGRGRILLRIPRDLPEAGSDVVAKLKYGDRIRAWVYCGLPRNFRNPGYVDRVANLSRRGIFLVGRIKSSRLLEILPGDCAVPWKALTVAARGRLRRLLQESIAAPTPDHTAILTSLLIGDQFDLSPATRETFQNAGSYHVLVVSGLHVGWIAWLLIRLLQKFRLPGGATRILVALGLLGYVSIVGFQASVSRALCMYLLYFVAQALFRDASPPNLALAAAFVLLAVNPDWLFDLGFRLSLCAVLAILLVGLRLIESSLQPSLTPPAHAGERDRLFFARGSPMRAGRRWRARAELMAEALADRYALIREAAVLHGIRVLSRAALHTGGLILISLSVHVLLSPLVAYHFNRLSWISLVSNLVIVPVASLALAAGGVAVLVSFAGLPTGPVVELATSCAALLVTTNERLADLAGAWQRCPTPSWIAVALLLCLVIVWRFMEWRRLWLPCAANLVFLLWIGIGTDSMKAFLSFHVVPAAPGAPRSAPLLDLQVTFLDVGQGDSVVIEYPDGRVWVLDAGGIWDSSAQESGSATFDTGETVVSRFLWSRGIRKLDRILLSHPHLDHAGGLPALIRNFRPAAFLYGEHATDALWAELQSAASRSGVAVIRVRDGREFAMGEVLLTVLNPPAADAHSSVNDNSLVLRLRYRNFTALLTGDLERDGERDIQRRTRDLRSLLLKVAHHGSRSATTDSFLEQTRPRWAVISAGRNNAFGHPSPEVIARLVRNGVRPLLTSDQGAITLTTDGMRYRLSSFVSGTLEQGILRH